jgi:hypothetical protein
MKAITILLEPGNLHPERKELKAWRLLMDAWQNTEVSVGFGGFKPPRNLSEVLLQSRHFEVTDHRDVFYATLGMCNVTVFTRATTQPAQHPDGAILVDYTKSITEVYHDASLCILHRKGKPINLANMWNCYRRSPLHGVILPLWAVDWRSGTFGEDYQAMLGAVLKFGVSKDVFLRPFPLSESDEEYPPGVRRERWEQKAFDRGLNRMSQWHWPEPVESDRRLLRLRARVLNYVAHLTEYTCTPEEFLGSLGGGPDLRSSIGLAGRSIHCKRMQSEAGANYALLYPHSKWEKYHPQSHEWRLAILGVGFDTQLCLVPSTTQKGDLTVAIAPNTLAMVISPMQGDVSVGGLIPPTDPYEAITPTSPKVNQITPIVYDISKVLCGLILGFNIRNDVLQGW